MTTERTPLVNNPVSLEAFSRNAPSFSDEDKELLATHFFASAKQILEETSSEFFKLNLNDGPATAFAFIVSMVAAQDIPTSARNMVLAKLGYNVAYVALQLINELLRKSGIENPEERKNSIAEILNHLEEKLADVTDSIANSFLTILHGAGLIVSGSRHASTLMTTLTVVFGITSLVTAGVTEWAKGYVEHHKENTKQPIHGAPKGLLAFGLTWSGAIEGPGNLAIIETICATAIALLSKSASAADTVGLVFLPLQAITFLVYGAAKGTLVSLPLFKSLDDSPQYDTSWFNRFQTMESYIGKTTATIFQVFAYFVAIESGMSPFVLLAPPALQLGASFAKSIYHTFWSSAQPESHAPREMLNTTDSNSNNNQTEATVDSSFNAPQ